MFVNFNILNQLGSPAINSNTFANRPAAGQTGRLFVSTDTFEIYRDNGTTWDLIGGPGSSTITGTGTATQVAYFTSSQAIGSSANLFWDNTNTRLGIGTATPGVALDIHSTGIMAQFNTTSATGNSYLAFQRTGTNVWRLGDQYNAGANFFQIHNIALSNNAVQIDAATNKTTWQAVQTYTTGLARANYFDYNLSVAAAGSFSSPNAITALGASLDLTLAGSATIPSGARSGLDAYNSIGFTGAGTLTHNQGAQIRAYSNLTAGWAFNGSATGTVTHLAGLRALFPDNTGSAINVTNNYALLLNDQTPNTGTVTYTNRWGIYQEGASDLNYLNANLLLGSTVNNGNKLQVTGNGNLTGDLTADAYYLNGMTAGNGALYWTSDRVTIANYNVGGSVLIEVNGGLNGLLINSDLSATFYSSVQATLLNTANKEGFRINASTTGALGSQPAYTYYTSTGSKRWATFLNVGDDKFHISNAANTELFTATQTGNFGINTVIPNTNSQLTLSNSTSTSLYFQATNTNAGTRDFCIITNNNNFGDLAIRQGTSQGSDATIGDFRFYIAPSGNVLIGTTTDAGEKLQISGKTKSTAYYSIKGTVNIVSGATATIYAIPASASADGLYFVQVEAKAGSSIYMASGVVTALAANSEAFFTSWYDGANVTLQVTGLNIEIVNGGFTTITWDYSILYQGNY